MPNSHQRTHLAFGSTVIPSREHVIRHANSLLFSQSLAVSNTVHLRVSSTPSPPSISLPSGGILRLPQP